MGNSRGTLPKLLNARQLGDQLSIKANTILRMAWEGRLPSVRIGRCIRFEPNEINKVLEKGRRPVVIKERKPKVFDG